MASRLSHRVPASLLLIAGASFAASAALTGVVARTLSPDGVVEARTAALLWTVRVRLATIGAGALAAAWALRCGSFRGWLRRMNAHPGSWLAASGLVFLYGAASLYIDPYLVSDLHPKPDAVEYAVSARQMLTGLSYTIPVGEALLPPRYPFGYPLLILPFYVVFGAALSNAVLCSLALTALTAALVYRTGERAWGRTAGVASALLALSSRAVVDAGRSVLSESAAMLAAACAAWTLVRLTERERPPRAWAFAGIVIGAGAMVRFSNVLLLAPAGLVLIRAYRGRVGDLAAALASLGAGCALALAPLLIYQAETFGGALRTGYSFWVPFYYDVPGNTFNLRYALQGAALGDVKGVPNALLYGGLLAGWRRFCYAVPTAVFVVIGAAVTLRQAGGRRHPSTTRRKSAAPLRTGEAGDSKNRSQVSSLKSQVSSHLCLFIAGATGITALFYTFYFFAEPRFLTPVVPLLALPAGAGLAATVDLSGWRRGRTAVCNLLCLWVVIEGVVTTGAGGAVSVPRRYEACRMVARRTEGDAVVVSGIDPLFFRVTAERQPIPVSRRVEYASKVVLPGPVREPVPEGVAHAPAQYAQWALARGARQAIAWTTTESPERVLALLLAGRPVYCDDYDLREDEAALRARFRFEPVDSVAGVHLYRLGMP